MASIRYACSTCGHTNDSPMVCAKCGRRRGQADRNRSYGRTHRQTRALLLPSAIGRPCPICDEEMTQAQADAGLLDLDHTTPPEARQLLAALSPADRPIYAAAIYSGLRCGELQALSWDDVDLASGVIRVRRSWDRRNRLYVTPKSRAGMRKVPILGVLRDVLIEVKLASGGAGLVFPGKSRDHFDHSSLRLRAITAWKAAGLVPIGLHECRHPFASLMIAAGVNAKALSVYMGHSNISTTFDRYGHLMPAGEEEAAALADAYLERANTAARLAAITS